MLDFIPSKKQTVWRWPAVLNFALGGAGAGFFLCLAFLKFSAGLPEPLGRASVVAPLLVIAGFASLALEAGRPFRARFVLRHLKRSWMSRESLAALIFVPTAILAWWMTHPLAWAIAAVAALAFVICQGFILYAARAIPAWNHPMIPLVFLANALASGSGITLVVLARSSLELSLALVVPVVVTAIIDALVWALYVFAPRQQAFRESTQPLRRRFAVVRDLAVLRLLPVLITLGFIMAGLPALPNHGGWRSSLLIAGAALFLANLVQKSSIVRGCGVLRSIGFAWKTPQMPAALNPAGSRPLA